MEFNLSMSSANLPDSPTLFAKRVFSSAGGKSATTSRRGTKYSVTGTTLSVLYDSAAAIVVVKQGKLKKEYPAPKVTARLTPRMSDMADRIGKRAAVYFNQDTSQPATSKTIKFKALAPAKLTKEQAAEVRAKYSPTFTKKLIALGNALLSIKEVARADKPASLMFWPFKYGPSSRKVKTAYGTLLRSDIYSMMGHSPSVPFTPVRTIRFKGTALCRVCGEPVGADTQVAANGTQRPSGAAQHYKKHGINSNLIEKIAVDKATGKNYLVRYIGAMNSL